MMNGYDDSALLLQSDIQCSHLVFLVVTPRSSRLGLAVALWQWGLSTLGGRIWTEVAPAFFSRRAQNTETLNNTHKGRGSTVIPVAFAP
ncbi:hypothetical protein [Denitratisoma oestradiolicum]|uniref:Uncharacterized protein n=1 Tax=Denitratisoma oestradiolicum TaxID=311182 RepID=A0A6S6XY22_9PROT|nr:hypothetical protein [Denitratisoma oestradiolicum]CAB1369908.1 protein of unknown function [Denitratisoma oestradiolicum]